MMKKLSVRELNSLWIGNGWTAPLWNGPPTAREVISFLEKVPAGVDIIISDIRMAGSDGLDIARYVSQNNVPVQVIFLTAYADFSYAKTAIEYSVTDFVLKSDISEGLPRAVEKAKALLVKSRMNGRKRWTLKN